MSKPYLDLIDDKITAYEREIARLTIAREVIAEIGPIQQRSPQPKLAAPKNRGKIQAPQIRSYVIAVLTEAGGPLTSREIFEKMPEGVDRKPMWNTIFNMKDKGILVRLEDGTYGLPQGEPS